MVKPLKSDSKSWSISGSIRCQLYEKDGTSSSQCQGWLG